MARRTIRTGKNYAAFLDALSQTGNVTHACEIANVARRSVYEWRDDDPDLAEAWEQAIEVGTNAMEDEAKRRAMSGSDVLLIFMLKHLRPAKYNPSATLNINLNLLGNATPEEMRAELTSILTPRQLTIDAQPEDVEPDDAGEEA